MKIEWLVANVTAVESLVRAECAILGLIVAGRVFGQFRSFLWLGALCGVATPSWALITLLRVI